MDNRHWGISRARPEPVSISPDGKSVVVRLVQGDCERNGVWVHVLTAGLQSLDHARKLEPVTQLFGTGLGPGTGMIGPASDTNDAMSPIRWLGNSEVSFLWSDPRGIRQVVAINLRTHKTRFLTDHPTHVRSFDVSSSGRVLYAAEAVPSQRKPLTSEAPVVGPNTDGFALLTGDLSGASFLDRLYNSEWFVKRSPDSPAVKVIIAGRDVDLTYAHTVHFSPNGRDALVATVAGAIPGDWGAYERGTYDRGKSVERSRMEPRGADARTFYQWFIVDTDTGTSRLLWPSLANNFGGHADWSPDGRELLFAPTYLPPESRDPAGLVGRAAAVVDAYTGTYKALPLEGTAAGVGSVKWVDGNTLSLGYVGPEGVPQTAKLFRRDRSRWLQVTQADSTPVGSRGEPDIRFTLAEDLNTPPRLFATDVGAGVTALVLDPNPGLADHFDLGRADTLAGTLPSGDTWTGLVFYPPNFSTRRKYPLVIQSQYGAPPGRTFSLYGPGAAPGLGPTLIAAYPGRALAARDFIVLTLAVSGRAPNEAAEYQAAFEAAAIELIQSGAVDERAVGLVGFSRNGYFVEYALTHSTFPFAAAVSADAWSADYLPAALTGWSEYVNAVNGGVNGGAPFGQDLAMWLKHAPGFNADKIRAPLRIVVQQFGAVGMLPKWELFSRLRYLRKPVELVGVPNAQYGDHNLQNPQQILTVQKGTIEWFERWLTVGGGTH